MVKAGGYLAYLAYLAQREEVRQTLFELWYSDAMERWRRAELGEGNGLGFQPLVKLAREERGQYEDATVLYSIGQGRDKIIIWSDAHGLRWSEDGDIVPLSQGRRERGGGDANEQRETFWPWSPAVLSMKGGEKRWLRPRRRSKSYLAPGLGTYWTALASQRQTT